MSDKTTSGPWVLQNSAHLQSLDDVITLYSGPRFKWKIQSGKGGVGRVAYAVLTRHDETGETWVLAVLENAAAPRHTHNPGARYGEMIYTIAGVLNDITDDGVPAQICVGDVLLHGEGTTHEPTAKFWFGLYHQPRGSCRADQPSAA